MASLMEELMATLIAEEKLYAELIPIEDEKLEAKLIEIASAKLDEDAEEEEI